MRSSAMAGAAIALVLAVPAGAGPVLEPVIVTATRTALPMDEVLAPVELITRAELDRAVAADAADLLRFRAGLEIARNGGPGQTTSLFIRGTESNHALVLVDGVRINPGTIGVAALQNLSPAMIERIEVVKGPRSTLYGSDAIGGVVNVITRSGADAGLRAQFGVGGYDTRTASLSAGAGGERGGVSFIGSWLDSQGFPTRSGDTVDRGYRNASLNLSGRTKVGGVELGARAWRSAGTSEYSDFFLTPVDQDYEDSTFSADASLEVRPGWKSRLSVAHALDDIQQNQADGFSGEEDFLRTRRWSLDWQNDLVAGRNHTLTFGALLQREQAEALSYGSGFDEETATDLVYAQDRVEFGRHRAMLAVGYTDHDSFGSKVTWNGEYGLMLGETRSGYVSVGTAFRAPDASDRYGYGGNPALRPESSRNVEVGLRQRIGQSQQITISAFRNDLTDLIEFTFTDPVTYSGENRNVARARIDGVEAGWSLSGELWQARAGLNWQDPRDLSTDTALLRRAQHNATLFVARRLGPHEVSLDLLAAGARYDFGYPDPVRLGGYVVANLAATLAAGPRWHVIARLENALDADYELARGYNTMGRTLFVSARYDFR